MSRIWVIVAILTIQVLSAFFFISDILSSYVGLWSHPLSWELRELLELAAASGLGFGIVFGALALWRAHRDKRAAEERLRVASGAFMELLDQRFAQWGLTAAEADVALFAIKGLSTAEIAAMRGTSDGTVKAETNAIYRKAGVSGRPQLLSTFIDDLMGGESLVRVRLAAGSQPLSIASTTASEPAPPVL